MIRGFFRLVGLLLLAGGFIFIGYYGRRLGAGSSLAFSQVWTILERDSSIQPAGVPGLGGGHCALALDQYRQNYTGPAGFRRDGGAGHSADAAVPAPQAVDRLFAELSGNAAMPA